MVHRDPSEGNGQKRDYDHSKTKPVEDAGKGKHSTEDKGDEKDEEDTGGGHT